RAETRCGRMGAPNRLGRTKNMEAPLGVSRAEKRRPRKTRCPDSRVVATPRVFPGFFEPSDVSRRCRSPLTVAGPCGISTHFAWPPGQTSDCYDAANIARRTRRIGRRL